MLTLWNGFDRRRDLDAMNDLFADFEARPRFRKVAQPALPPVDVVETEQAYELTAEVPGLKAEDVDLSLHEGVLTLSAKAATEDAQAGDEARKTLYRERRAMEFERSFRIGDDIDDSGVEASVENGILTVILPKAPQAKPRQIAVKTK